MSWVRFGQLSAEGQSLADVAGLGGAGYVVSNATAFTGSWSYRTSGQNAPLGFAGTMGVAARCGMQFRHNGATGNNTALIGFMIDGAPLVWRFDTFSNNVTLRAGFDYNSANVRYPISAVNVPALARMNTWMHIGMVAYMASGGFVSLYVDGVQAATWTGDTQLYRSQQATPRTAITGIYAAGYVSGWADTISSWASYAYIDDFYADTWMGEAAPVDAPVPSRRFLPAFPSAAGSSAQWTPNTGANWQAIDEAPPDDDATYNRATAAGLRDLVEMSNISVPPDWAVRAVIPTIYARKTDAGVDSQIKLVVSGDGGTLVSDAKPLPISYGYLWERWTEQADHEPWSEAAINAAQMGYESAGDF